MSDYHILLFICQMNIFFRCELYAGDVASSHRRAHTLTHSRFRFSFSCRRQLTCKQSTAEQCSETSNLGVSAGHCWLREGVEKGTLPLGWVLGILPPHPSPAQVRAPSCPPWALRISFSLLCLFPSLSSHCWKCSICSFLPASLVPALSPLGLTSLWSP